MALRDYARFFRASEEGEEQESLARAREILDWASKPYHGRFLAWLEKEASKPIKITGDQLAVLESAVRSNTMREVRSYLIRTCAGAESALREQ